ncbi:hypothetical protein V8B97DRAFT_2024051 [Scleroderma yunnanense]
MGSNFHWEDIEQFISLVNLLSLHNGSQLSLSSAGEEDKQIHITGSSDMGGDNSSETNTDVKVSLLVMHNKVFGDCDQGFFSSVKKLLLAIGASVFAKTKVEWGQLKAGIVDLKTVKDALWEELLHYNTPHLDYYVNTLKRNLKSFKSSRFLNNIPPYNTTLLSLLGSDTDARTFCNDTDIGTYSENTHNTYMRFAQDHIQDLDSILLSINKKSYSIRHMMSIRSIQGFSHLSIVLISPSALPPLDEMMKHLGLSLNLTFLSITSARQSFKQCQNDISQRCLPAHAELQLILHIMKRTDIETMNKEIYPYIGCSKLSCFLCDSFLKSFIYPFWSIPDITGLHDNMVIMLNLVVEKMQNILAHEMTKPISSTPHVPESSAGVTYNKYEYMTAWAAVISFVPIFPPYNIFRIFSHCKAFTSDVCHCMFSFFLLDGAELSMAFTSSPTCASCGHKMSRKCSKCRGPWLCSQSCEISWGDCGHDFICMLGRPLDSTDHLICDCRENIFSDDEDTLKDFGFTKFTSIYDWWNLLGLYIGLTCIIGVGSQELHQWQFEALPQDCHGRYYPCDSSQDILAAVQPYLEPEDRSKAPHELTPKAKAELFLLYSMLLNGSYPNPSLLDQGCQDLYFNFTFVTGCGSEGEEVLPPLYQMLISKCSFKEFWLVYQSRGLITLMDMNGLQKAFLNIHLYGTSDSLQSSDVDPPWSIFMDYRFCNCNTIKNIALKSVYKDLLENPQVDPMELQAACMEGKLYNFVCQYDPDLNPRFKRLMENLYLLSC